MSVSKSKQKLIDATIKVLQDYSIQDISMRNIAKEAGVTTGSIYHHYKNKDELLLDVMEHSLHFTPKLYEITKKEGYQKTGPELLEEVNKQVEERIRKIEQQELHIQFFSNVLKRNPEFKDVYKDNYKKILESTSKLMLKSFEIETSKITPILSSILVAAIDGVAMQQSLNILPGDLDTYIEVFNDFFTKSLYKYLEKE